MDILILNWKDIKNPQKGGAEVIAHAFARRLVAEGHSVTFFSRNYADALEKEKVDNIIVIRRGNALSVYFKAYLYYKQLKQKPDLVIDMVNSLCWQTPLYVPQAKRIMYVNQLAKEVWFYEKRFPFSAIGYFLERFEYITYKHTKVICYSNSTKEDLVSVGIPIKNIHIFPLGLDHSRYVVRKPKSITPLFLFVARLVRMKRADICIQAIQRLYNTYPSIKLIIIGTGSDESRLRTLIRKYSLENTVEIITKNNFFVDKNSRDVKTEMMQKAWALLLPSVKEGWGMVVTEAAACGTPAIVSNVTGLKDSVVNGKTGIVLSSNPTEQELATAMRQLIEQKELLHQLSNGAEQWAKNFDWDTSYEQFRNLLVH